MTFEEILPHLKSGSKYRRQAWGSWVLYICVEAKKFWLIHKYIALREDDNLREYWYFNQGDILANDWEIVE